MAVREEAEKWNERFREGVIKAVYSDEAFPGCLGEALLHVPRETVP